ncbi:hypothetical protein [Streptomyces sp. NPDC018031]|uniref:hypothetical protein n=1 Tax=Streptomyces sp. NPDC018031 TaxID=3365033 RepID=UPI0037A0695B
MGIESDRLVYDYLSQVGDLAQQRGLPSRDRMRLVASLRSEIEQRRAGAGSAGLTEAGVKRILGRLGTPADVVAEAGGTAAGPDVPAGAPGPAGTAADDSDDGGPARGPSFPTGPAGALRGLGGRLGRGGATRDAGRSGGTAGDAPGVPGPRDRGAGSAGQAGRRSRGVSERPGTPMPPDPSETPRPREPLHSHEDTEPHAPRPSRETDDPRPSREADGPRRDAAEARPSGPAEPAAAPDAREPAARRISRTARERLTGFAGRNGLTGKGVPGPRAGADPLRGAEADRPRGASPPHLAGEDELSSRESDPDWWRTDPGPFAERRDSTFGTVDGFTGGIELPELLKPPPAEEDEAERDPAAVEQDVRDGDAAAGSAGGAGTARRGLLRRALRRRGRKAPQSDGDGGGKAAGAGAGAGAGLMVVPAIGLLLAGAFLGNIIVLAIGWLVAYYLCRLGPKEAKLAVLVLPGLVAAAAMVWVWGRLDGRWGDPIPEGGLGDVLKDTWPVVVRTAAVVSALFLLWRARRRRQG